MRFGFFPKIQWFHPATLYAFHNKPLLQSSVCIPGILVYSANTRPLFISCSVTGKWNTHSSFHRKRVNCPHPELWANLQNSHCFSFSRFLQNWAFFLWGFECVSACASCRLSPLLPFFRLSLPPSAPVLPPSLLPPHHHHHCILSHILITHTHTHIFNGLFLMEIYYYGLVWGSWCLSCKITDLRFSRCI